MNNVLLWDAKIKMTESRWWEQPLDGLSHAQWESLCDGCGKCCLHKLQDDESDELYFTAVACRYLDAERVQCNCYTARASKNPDCLIISPENLPEISDWLPKTCAYRLRFENQTLPAWHPLISGDTRSVEAAGQSVRHRTISEDDIDPDDWEELILIDMI
ncbi:YcgN family cysteine cluster protein [Hahella sp. CR1]|uniref:YcgN family cysteine cluster protein n=1 Tax=Hahella sp. CR1 TaxID=2992807 RepID=UPI0024418163|nr:YcgN family cysteine cluster protein [Hahella sp. CR1]MDG9667949.1 YcgN family cysteine cluster protein [Hahella sp. CR1]